MTNLHRMTKQDKEVYIDKMAGQLLALSLDEYDITFILGKWNTVYIGGEEYALKLEKRGN